MNASGHVDLDEYFRRVGWKGPVTPTYGTLAGILHAHVTRIPFENLDVLLGRPVRLDVASVHDKLVRRGRGGYCFEHVTLLAAVLEQLRFAVVRHTARVTRVVPRTEAPRTHVLLTVSLPEGVFVVDPGFGGHAPRVPLPLVEGAAAECGEDTHWMEHEDGHWQLRARADGSTMRCWATTIETDNLVDFEVGNHYTATHPDSPFVQRLMMHAYTSSGRTSVMNRDVREWRDGVAYPRRLATRHELRELVAQIVGVDMPEIETLRVPTVPEWAA